MKPSKYAMKLYIKVNGDITKFFKEMQELGKSFSISERQYYARRANSYNRYA